MAKAKNELQVIELDKFDINQLPELQNKKAEVAKRLKEFKYVAIVDAATYEEAKKSRTGARSIRTELQTEEKTVNKKIKEFILGPVKNAYVEIIADVIHVENRQQEEVSRHEDIKEQERLAKLRAEEERVTKIREAVVNFENECNAIVKGSTIENVKANKEQLGFMFESNFDFMEFQQLFEMAKHRVQASFHEKCGEIQKQEEQRLENERIKAEQLEQKRVFDIKEKFSNWKNTWLTKLSTLTFEESKTVQKEFSEELALDCQEFQESYSIARAEIQALIERTIGHLEITHKQIMQNEAIAKENRLKMEAFQKEKAEFEAKQNKEEESKKQLSEFEAKTNNRIIELVSYDLKFDFVSTYTDGKFFIDILDIKTYSDEKWNELITKISETKVDETVQEVEGVVIFKDGVAEVSEEVADTFKGMESVFGIDPYEEVSENKLASMNYNDKLEVLTKWLSTQDEIILDELIEKYLN